MDPILLLHSAIDGHLGCLHLLATVNDAATVWLCKHLVKPCLQFFWINTQRWPHQHSRVIYTRRFYPLNYTGGPRNQGSIVHSGAGERLTTVFLSGGEHLLCANCQHPCCAARGEAWCWKPGPAWKCPSSGTLGGHPCPTWPGNTTPTP